MTDRMAFFLIFSLYVPTLTVLTIPRSVAIADNGVSAPVAGFVALGTPATFTSKLLSSLSTR